uniref:DUF19 domain-containing protein n=1 Tax=Strigamia maritima TaxID=126957 RepID=T1J5L3_STRMM
MFLTRINLFILLCFICDVSAENQLKVVLEKAISNSCKSSYYVGKDVENFQICFGNDIRNIMNNVDAATVNSICKLDVTRCFKQLSEAVKDCLSPTQHKEIFEDPVKAIAAGHNYVCSNNAQPLKNFTMRQPLCPYHLAVGHLSDKCKDKIIKEELFTQSFQSDIGTACGERVEFLRCWVDAYDDCNDRIGSNFFKNLGVEMLEPTPCKSLVSSMKPTVSANLIMPSSPSTLMKRPKDSSKDSSDAIKLVSSLLHFPILYLPVLCRFS